MSVHPEPEPEPQPEEPHYFSLYVDNDSAPLMPKLDSTDSDYTGGIQFAWTGRWTRWLGGPRWLVDKGLFFGRVHDGRCAEDGRCKPGAEQAHDFRIGLSAFTPRKGEGDDPDCIGTQYEGRHGCVLGLTRPLADDRPYASLLYVTMGRTTAQGSWAFHSELTVGMLGLRVAGKIQTKLHLGLKDVVPGGWPFQISNGGEPTVGYRILVQHLVYTTARDEYDPCAALELTWDAAGDAGYYTKGEGGARMRFGRLGSPFWTSQRRPVGPTIIMLTPLKSDERAARRPPWISQAYVFGSLGGEAWLYNALLQGQFRHSEVRLHFGGNGPTSLNRGIANAQSGLVIGSRAGFRLWPLRLWARDLNFTYQKSWMSALFSGPHSRIHQWGGVYLGANFEWQRK